MPVQLFDFRTDVRNLLVTPWIRSRFLRMEPGQVAALHSHDLGHEIFLVLQGRAAFEVDGETVEMGPGQLCAVLANEAHIVRCLGDEPMTMYLSVTPHVQPTHTGRTPDGGRVPHRFMPNRAYDIEIDASVTAAELADRQADLAQSLAATAQTGAESTRAQTERLKQALATNDAATAAEARAELWATIYVVYRQLDALTAVWNELAPRCDIASDEPGA